MMVAFGTLLLDNSPSSIYLSFSERSLVELGKTSAMIATMLLISEESHYERVAPGFEVLCSVRLK